MLLFRQLELLFSPKRAPIRDATKLLCPVAASLCDESQHYSATHLQRLARKLLSDTGARPQISESVTVEWNSRLQTCAGRADFRNLRITLNPRLVEHGYQEIDRTLRHELAHILAHARAGRRRIQPHGLEWRRACHDLGIGDEKRCHNLAALVSRRARRFLYKCPNCRRDFPRVRRIRRAIACLACCRAHNRGKFDARFRLKLAKA